MDGIDIELCRRLAGLAVFFVIELISRFGRHQCSIRRAPFLRIAPACLADRLRFARRAA
jgi:hypothetical protein